MQKAMHEATLCEITPPHTPQDLYTMRGPGTVGVRTGASYIWLAYSGFFFIEPVLRHSLHYWLTQLPVYVVFLALYTLYVEVAVQRVRLGVIASLFALGALTMPHNAGGSCFFVYVASLLPFCVESLAGFLAVVAAELVALTIENLLFPGKAFNYGLTGFFILVVGVSNLFIAQSKRAQMKLARAQAENVALAAVAERERIARDLHDVLGHTLSVVVLKAELARRLIERDPRRAATEMAEVERTARLALAEVREAIGGYRTKGLSAEVEQARQTLDAAGVQLICPAAPPSLRAREETVLSLAVREAVTNIVRHARATECTVRFAVTAGGLASLDVADNGTAALAIPREGNGLRGMRERVEELGGHLQIETGLGLGTRLHIELPAGRTA